MSSSLPQRKKVLRLRPHPSVADEPASQMAIKVRTHLSLLQGYADIMEGLSPQLKKEILQVMAQKTRELGTALQPFTEPMTDVRPAIGDYRRVARAARPGDILTFYVYAPDLDQRKLMTVRVEDR